MQGVGTNGLGVERRTGLAEVRSGDQRLDPETRADLESAVRGVSDADAAARVPGMVGGDAFVRPAALEPGALGTGTLRQGTRGEPVRALQTALNDLGFDSGQADGIFGRKTDRAVREFQRANGLTVDGIVGRDTRRALEGGEASGPTTRATTEGERGAGLDRRWRGFREVDEQALRDALPSQAQHLAPAFIEAGRNHDIDPLVLAGISRHETGNWTSSAFRNKNNAMGVSNRSGPIRFGSAEASIDSMARSLARPDGYYRNADTIREMWGVYAPGPATGGNRVQNDPGNLNRSWGGAVSRNIDELERRLFAPGGP